MYPSHDQSSSEREHGELRPTVVAFIYSSRTTQVLSMHEDMKHTVVLEFQKNGRILIRLF